MKQFAQGHSASEWQSWGSDSALAGTKPCPCPHPSPPCLGWRSLLGWHQALVLRSKRTPAPGGCGERGKRRCLSHLGSSPHVAGGSVGRSAGCRALLRHPWNKGFHTGVTDMSCWCQSSPACPGREVWASGHWPWPMFGLLPRIPTLARESPGWSRGMGEGSASACLGVWVPGWGQEVLMGERCPEPCQAGHCGWGDTTYLLWSPQDRGGGSGAGSQGAGPGSSSRVP